LSVLKINYLDLGDILSGIIERIAVLYINLINPYLFLAGNGSLPVII
jgi:hypothetical protein